MKRGQIAAAVLKYGHDEVMVSSFTKGASTNIGVRVQACGLPISKELVGTLHAICLRQLGHPALTEDTEARRAWNEEHPGYALSGDRASDPDEYQASSKGDGASQIIQTLRARMVPEEDWPTTVLPFWSRWKAWKEENSLMDFTDLIETCLLDDVPSPVRGVGFFDEAQDFSRLEMALVRKWGKEMDHLILVGDEDQSLYTFKGGDPEVMLYPELSPEHLKVLGQSYRVPEKVRAFSEGWIKRVSQRYPKEYRPRVDETGAVVEGSISGSRWDFQTCPERLVDEVEKHITAGRSVMLLASCSFMLVPLLKVLRERGVPFHNPYVERRGDWNPLNAGGVSSTQRLLALLRPDEATWGSERRRWTKEDIEAFGAVMNAQGVFWRGVKATLSKGELDTIDLDRIFCDEACSTLVWGDAAEWVDWWERHLVATRRRGAAFPCDVFRKRGGAALRDKPLVTVGTIHSVKGGESDVVYVSPDLSPQAAEQWSRSGDARSVDSILRQFYVAFTRAREELVLCQPSGSSAVSWRWKT